MFLQTVLTCMSVIGSWPSGESIDDGEAAIVSFGDGIGADDIYVDFLESPVWWHWGDDRGAGVQWVTNSLTSLFRLQHM